MKKIAITLILALLSLTNPATCFSQLDQKITKLLGIQDKKINSETVITEETSDTYLEDSLKIELLKLQIRQLEKGKALSEEPEPVISVPKKEKKIFATEDIDTIHAFSAGIPLVFHGDTLLSLHTKRGGKAARYRVEDATNALEQLMEEKNLQPDSLYIHQSEQVTDIMYKDRVILSLTDYDAAFHRETREVLAQQYLPILKKAIQKEKESKSLTQIGKRIFYFLLVVLIQSLLLWLTTYVYRKAKRKIISTRQQKLKPFFIKNYEFLTIKKQVSILVFAVKIVKYAIILVQLLITVPILFAIFPQTEDLAMKLFSYILFPVKEIGRGIINYIPDLFIIAAIYLAIRWLIRGIHYMANEIEAERLKITGFYPDWAQPSFNIIRFLLYAFMIAMIYPYLPGSDTGVFQGISVFVGLIVSLGSTTVIGNIIAGLVITYMRPFKVGDFIKLNETTGNVIEKTAFVTRIRTPKNEVITIPNSFIMSSHTVNYSSSARNFGLIIHTTVTIGYDAPWRQVHDLLVQAAQATNGVESEPVPFVLETGLSDFYPEYQINAYIRNTDRIARIYSELHQNIQDAFNKAGVEIMSPHYRAERDGNASTIPVEYTRKTNTPAEEKESELNS